MPRSYAQNNGNLSAITLCLVVVLIIIRINPIYYAAQFIPVRHADMHSLSAVRQADNVHGVLRCQRGISERIELIAVPQIRFTGVPFTAFFTKLFNENRIAEQTKSFRGVPIPGALRVAILRNLRL